MAHPLQPTHPVTRAVAGMRAAATDVVEVPVWSLGAAETGAALVELSRLAAQVAELQTRLLAHGHTVEVGAQDGATSPEVWVANQTRQTQPSVRRTKKLAGQLQSHPRLRDGMAAGDLLPDQAHVIAEAVDQLPDDLDSTVVKKAEDHLIGLASDLDANGLRIAGDKIFAVIAPEEADAREAKLLEAAEKRAAAKTRFAMHRDGHGLMYGRFAIPELHGDALMKALRAIAAPKHLTATEQQSVVHKPGPEKLGHAFCELIETLAAKDLPKAGGVSATMAITIDYDALTGLIEKSGILDTGQRISPAEARRLACGAGILPVILDGESQPLDLGRTSRGFSTAQRTAMAIRDHGCTADGCDWPPGMCHAHHVKPWYLGGASDLDNGRLLCPKHHRMAHDSDYTVTYRPDGTTSFHRRS